MTTSLQEIRELFRKDYYQTDKLTYEEVDGSSRACVESIADFWLAKYESLIKERDAELVEKIEEMKKYDRQVVDLYDVYNEAIDDVLLLLTTTPTEGGE